VTLSDEILKAAERRTGGSGPAPSPPISSEGRAPMHRAGPMPSQSSTRSQPNGSHSAPHLPSATTVRSGMNPPVHQSYDPARSRSTEPPHPRAVGSAPSSDPRYAQHPNHHPNAPGPRGHSVNPPSQQTRPGQYPQSHNTPGLGSRNGPTHHQGRI
jgi:hypothetical protein